MLGTLFHQGGYSSTFSDDPFPFPATSFLRLLILQSPSPASLNTKITDRHPDSCLWGSGYWTQVFMLASKHSTDWTTSPTLFFPPYPLPHISSPEVRQASLACTLVLWRFTLTFRALPFQVLLREVVIGVEKHPRLGPVVHVVQRFVASHGLSVGRRNSEPLFSYALSLASLPVFVKLHLGFPCLLLFLRVWQSYSPCYGYS